MPPVKRHLNLLTEEVSTSAANCGGLLESVMGPGRNETQVGAAVVSGVRGEVDSQTIEPPPSGDEFTSIGEFLQVGDLAKVTGKTVRAIHLYESLGLIEPAKRSKGRYRLFSPETQSRVRWIAKLQSLGLSLSEIQGIAERRRVLGDARSASSDLLGVYSAKLREVRERLAEYLSLEQELVASVAFLEACEHACVGETHVSGCAQCERRQDDGGHVPDLVSGAQA